MSQKTKSLVDRINSRNLSLTANLRNLNESERTVELSFSSEAEVKRWYGIEILGHNPGEVRMGRLNSGGPFLMDHNRRDQIGTVVEGSAVIDGKKGRCTVKISRSSRGEEILQDIADGIRKNCSVCYLVHEAAVVGERDGEQIVRVTDWEPTEVSLVSVPADTTVGVGREADEDKNKEDGFMLGDKGKDNANKESQERELTPQADISAVREEARKAEQDRVRTLLALGDKFSQRELADKYVSEGRSVEDFSKELLNKTIDSKEKNSDVREASLGMSNGEVGQYSFIRAIRALANPTDRRAQEAAGFEFECSRAAAEQIQNRDVKGMVVPYDVLRRALLNTATPASGGHLVDTTLLTNSFIELLRKRAIALQMAMQLGGLVGNVDIPAQAAGATGYWVGEDGDVDEGEAEFSNAVMSPKTVGAFSEVSRRMLMQSSLDVEALVRSDLAKALALTIDRAAFYGFGGDNQPKGIISFNGVNATAFAAENPTYKEIVAMETEVSADDADVDGMCYIGNARFRGHCKTTERFAGTSGLTIWEKGNTVNGYAAKITNQIENGDVLFGNFGDLLVGMWGGLELTVDPYTHSTKGRLRVVSMQDVDFAVRHVESFCYGKKVAA